MSCEAPAICTVKHPSHSWTVGDLRHFGIARSIEASHDTFFSAYSVQTGSLVSTLSQVRGGQVGVGVASSPEEGGSAKDEARLAQYIADIHGRDVILGRGALIAEFTGFLLRYLHFDDGVTRMVCTKLKVPLIAHKQKFEVEDGVCFAEKRPSNVLESFTPDG